MRIENRRCSCTAAAAALDQFILSSMLFCGGRVRCRAPTDQIAHPVSLCVFFVHRSCRDAAGVARAVGVAIVSKDKCDRAFQHKQSSIKPMSVRFTMLVWFDFAFAKLIALVLKIGFELGPVHDHHLFSNVTGNLKALRSFEQPQLAPKPDRSPNCSPNQNAEPNFSSDSALSY
jgi:hypothetical protein